ncbi:WD repeat-containing protein 75 [Phymastichus coffea]|uniref:WD repeat-containing protein 75 n=1 Tax=Phymastichus coffea TaxID=108790 RepID=UPI00273CD57D|nr:WD repeat-containing protein 75 [Phymastichus coffea]
MQLKENRKIKPNKMSSIKSDDLILKRKGGGSIIDHRPLFSNDGETLYVVWKQVIKAYSATTGDFVKELEPAHHKIVNIVISPENPDTLIGCTDNAELVHWNCHNGLITSKTKLGFPKSSKIKLRSFHIMYYKTFQNKDMCNGVISSVKVKGDNVTLRLELFDLKLGTRILNKEIENFSKEYYIDIIGNYGNNLIAIAQETFLYILSPTHALKFNRHKTGRKVTCVSGHPEEECVAIGDVSGRVVVLKDILQTNTVRAVYHWHTLAVTEIAFSKSGGHMYTGGGECVLVKWLVSNPQNKSFLPRLPAPIRYLTVAPENIYVAVSTLDNGIIIVNPQRKLTAVIQNFTWGVASSPKSLFPAGLTVDPRTNSLVLNSRTGHVQFFNPRTKSLLYNVNITAQNILTQERDAIIVNTEVTRVAISSDGVFMATMEERDDGVSSMEIRLKFWEFHADKQNFVLNTSIELPHENGVNALKFKPKTSLGDEEQFVVTVGKDKKFKMWQLIHGSTSEGIKRHWKCYSVGYYAYQSALDAEFSVDGSLIGVGFGSTLTLWSTENSVLKSCLSHSHYPHPITRIEFGKQSNECIHLVVAASSEHMAIWDLLSLSMKWSVPINLTILTSDPLSDYMAAFTADSTLFVFTPASHEPVYIRKNLVEKDTTVLAACFSANYLNNEEETVMWQRKSQLFFLDSEQELLTLESKSESSKALENLSASRNLPLTAFNRLVAAERITNVEKTSVVHDYIKGISKNAVEELLSVPAHTLPPMRMLCMPFILSLMGTSGKVTKDTPTKKTIKVNEDQSDSEDEHYNIKTILTGKEKNLNNEKETKDKSTKLIDLDWSFLSAILPSDESVS